MKICNLWKEHQTRICNVQNGGQVHTSYVKKKELEMVPQVIWKGPGTVPWGMPQVRYWLSERSQPFHSLSLNFMIIVLKSMISQLELVSVCYVFLHLYYYKIKNIYFTNRLHAFGVCTPYWSLHVHATDQQM